MEGGSPCHYNKKKEEVKKSLHAAANGVMSSIESIVEDCEDILLTAPTLRNVDNPDPLVDGLLQIKSKVILAIFSKRSKSKCSVDDMHSNPASPIEVNVTEALRGANMSANAELPAISTGNIDRSSQVIACEMGITCTNRFSVLEWESRELSEVLSQGLGGTVEAVNSPGECSRCLNFNNLIMMKMESLVRDIYLLLRNS